MALRLFNRFDWPVTLGCMVLLGYLAFHAFYGTRGYQFLQDLQGKSEMLQAELQVFEGKRMELEAKVSHLRPERVDPDLLEELARTQLELSRPNDLIVQIPK